MKAKTTGKEEPLDLELRVREMGWESITGVRVPAGTDAKEVLRVIGAGSMTRNIRMPFSGDIRYQGCAFSEGKLESGMYTIHGPKGIDQEMGYKIRSRYRSLNLEK